MRTSIGRVEKWAGVVAILVAIFAAFFAAYTQQHDASRAACQTRVNQEFLVIIKQRAVLSTENTDNLNYFVQQLLKSKNYTHAQDEAVIKTYETKLAEINVDLRKATYPAIGNC